MRICYQIREDINKYFVNARSIRFKFKCLHATCPVVRNIKNQMGDRMYLINDLVLSSPVHFDDAWCHSVTQSIFQDFFDN